MNLESGVTSIADKLQALRNARTPFPLTSLLHLYATCSEHPHSLYVNYFEGFKLLVDWLSPIEIPVLDTSNPSSYKIPKVFYTYEVQEIAHILHCHPSIIYNSFRKIYYGN